MRWASVTIDNALADLPPSPEGAAPPRPHHTSSQYDTDCRRVLAVRRGRPSTGTCRRPGLSEAAAQDPNLSEGRWGGSGWWTRRPRTVVASRSQPALASPKLGSHRRASVACRRGSRSARRQLSLGGSLLVSDISTQLPHHHPSEAATLALVECGCRPPSLTR